MLLEREREEIVRACRKLSAAGLVVGTAGNVSVRDGDLVAVTPSGVDYAELAAGTSACTGSTAPRSRRRSRRPASCRCTWPSTARTPARGRRRSCTRTRSRRRRVATLVDELPPIHYYVAMFGGPVRVAPYATYGTDELAATPCRRCAGAPRCLLGSHGAVTIGPDLKTAYDRSVYLEWVCDVYLRAAAAGTPRLLPPGEIEAVAARLASYGQRP